MIPTMIRLNQRSRLHLSLITSESAIIDNSYSESIKVLASKRLECRHEDASKALSCRGAESNSQRSVKSSQKRDAGLELLLLGNLSFHKHKA